MKCPEIREYLIAFLDNELESQISVDIQLHLDHCCHCANEAEIERTIHKHLSEFLYEEHPETMMGHKKMIRNLQASDSKERAGRQLWLSRKWWAAAILILIVSGVFMIIGSRFKLQSRSESFAAMLVKDSQHLANETPFLAIVSDNPEKIARWILQKMHWDVKIPKNNNPSFQLLGARRCSIGGRHVALTYYQINGVPVSLVILPSSQNDFTGMQLMDDGSNYFAVECQGYVVVASQDGSLTYAAIGKVSKNKLLGLIPVSL